jgi:hypothetical protein
MNNEVEKESVYRLPNEMDHDPERGRLNAEV